MPQYIRTGTDGIEISVYPASHMQDHRVDTGGRASSRIPQPHMHVNRVPAATIIPMNAFRRFNDTFSKHPASSPVRRLPCNEPVHTLLVREALSSPGPFAAAKFFAGRRSPQRMPSTPPDVRASSVPRLAADHPVYLGLAESPSRPRVVDRRPHQIPAPSPTRPVNPVAGPHGGKKRDAYDAFSSPPDQSWSTLPAKKKREAKSARGGASVSNKFSLPLSLPRQPAAQGSRSGKALYVPPPRSAKEVSAPSNDHIKPIAGGWKMTRVTLQDALQGLGQDLGMDTSADANDDVDMRRCPSPPRPDSSSPPHPLIRYENQPAHVLESGARAIARKSKPASSHTPRRPGPQFSAPGGTNLAEHSSAPSLRSPSFPAIQADKLCGGTEGDRDAVVRLPVEPEALRARYTSARRAIAK
ncbi:hypothetical protein PsYK624_149280 [Phanerochaete sordida]|uniref:Uncharacterized protein n=1 Tax=Phanerochaete sordida TaxID=48140 RepID=A0A9P3GPG6_9APHY|nr:hypothetical protein PsYK624_149280 [Phanerochaete sordida]